MPRDKVGGKWTWFMIHGPPKVRLRAVIQHPQEVSMWKGLVQGAISDHCTLSLLR